MCLAVLCLCRWCVSTEPLFTVSAPEPVYDTGSCICDAVSATLRRDSATIYLFRSAWNTTYKFWGPLSDPERHRAYARLNKDLFAIPSGLPVTAAHTRGARNYANFYLKNVIDLGHGELLGFLHLEYMRALDGANLPTYPAVYRIGLCHSRDSGDSWKFCGEIVAANDTTPGACNIGGVPVLTIGAYLYVYFNEKLAGAPELYPSVARAHRSRVIAAARKGTTTRWVKYDSQNGTWDQDGLAGVGSRVVTAPDSAMGLDMHTDAAYCAPLGQYLLIVNALPYDTSRHTRLYLYRSNDGLRWEDPHLLVRADNNYRHPVYPYFASVAPDASADCGTVGREFFVCYINQHFEPTVPVDLPLFRIALRIAGQPIAPAQ